MVQCNLVGANVSKSELNQYYKTTNKSLPQDQLNNNTTPILAFYRSQSIVRL
jgi:hypothetical protein